MHQLSCMLQPCNVVTWTAMGMEPPMTLRDRLQSALKDFTKAINLDLKDAVALDNRALVYDELGETQKAETDRKKSKVLSKKP